MNDFVNKYKNKQQGGKPRQQQKANKKAVTNALHETFKMAMSGQIGGIQHEGVHYLMMKQEVFQGIIQNGGQFLLTDEQKKFHNEYIILNNMMKSLSIDDDKESELHDELDQHLFEFSENMNDPKGGKKRTEILKEYRKTIESHELLISLEKNLRKQLFPTAETEEVANNGKLT